MRTYATKEDAVEAGQRLGALVEAAAGPGGCIFLMPAKVDGVVSMMCHVFGSVEQGRLARQGLDTLARWIISAKDIDLGAVGETPDALVYTAAAMAMETLRGQVKGLILFVHRADDSDAAMAMIDGDPQEFMVLAEKSPGWAREWADKTMKTIAPALAGGEARKRSGGAN